jgi:hypothetical protein
MFWSTYITDKFRMGFRLSGDESSEVVFDVIEGGRDAATKITTQFTKDPDFPSTQAIFVFNSVDFLSSA